MTRTEKAALEGAPVHDHPPSKVRISSKATLRPVGIAGVGSYVPERILTNRDLERMVETSDEWITTRTGIKERRLAGEKETASDMACEAGRRALAAAGVRPEEVDLIIVATITPDMPFPSTACLVQRKIGASRAAAFDIEAACSGFVYALDIAAHFIAAHTYETVLVIGSEKMSSVVDWTDRNTCVLFGDGAGAAVLRPRRHGAGGLLTTCLGSDGGKASLLELPGGGSLNPPTSATIAEGLHFLRMDGRETFKSAVNAMVSAATTVLETCGVSVEQVACIIPHQANHRIIAAVAERLNASPDKLFVNVDRYGNTSAASVAIALDEAVRTGRIRRGDLVLLVVFGAGLTWGAALIEW
jgi:3-oxoacyl-[acyl-carrier-protein] synthase III